MWWGARPDASTDSGSEAQTPTLGTDYRNEGVPRDALWRLPGLETENDDANKQLQSCQYGMGMGMGMGDRTRRDGQSRDPNTRGRGRTVETQSGGLAVWRAVFLLAGGGDGGA